MTNPDDLRRLIASPYEPDPEAQSAPRSAIGWVAPLAAGIVGLVAAVVFIAMIGDDVAEVAADPGTPGTTLSSGAEVVFEQAEGFPEGFTPIDDAVAVRPISMYDIDGRTYVSIAAAVSGTADPATTSMRSIADWYLETGSGRIEPYNQTVNDIASGTIQFGFDGLAEPAGATLVVRPAASFSTQRVTLLEDAPIELLVEEPITVDVGGVPIVIDRLFYNDVWGHIAWHSPDDVPATVEVIVSFLGTEGIVNDTDLPLRIISFNSASVFFDIEGPFEVPAWATSGQAALRRHGPFSYDETTAQSVLVEVVISVADVADETVQIPLDSLVADG
jgi:hypothetical protein